MLGHYMPLLPVIAQEKHANYLRRYFADVHQLDADEIWIQICEGVDVSWFIRDFFLSYVNNSVHDRPCLGPDDSLQVRGINSAITVDGMWRSLIGMAEAGILQDRRHADPTNEDKWTSGHCWIEEELPDLMDLNRKQSFEKKEMTPEDIMVLLGTFWTQARHIPCLPQTRVAFHCAIFIAGIGGFRPGEVMNLKYRQVAFELVQDPRDPLKQRLSFCVTTIPYFKSLADILERPNLGQVDSLPLSWAAGMEDKEIIPIHYPTYLDPWHRTLLVAGLRDDTQRPYSLRVGAGGQLSGSLEEPPWRVTHDLVATAFGRGMAGDVADLFKSLRRLFLQRDPDAPLYSMEADIKALESRQDLTDLRAAYSDAVARTSSDDKDAKCVAGKIAWIRKTLAKEQLRKMRNDYFERTDRVRALGEVTTRAADHGTNPFKTFDPKGALAAEAIGQFVQRLDITEHEEGAVKLVT
ncbi:Uu.00g061390.m01.CDS01 [Anthostomella pinea]|uniref:Uu.00g061390.m01.CDS01 n=1 Tax=Anthostomella pinea TaxID=933095 RepID=A0AAI8VT41_9PEZI|nr:Uu.00g061390.m01.CDS01 [Anthostomella pinea]